MHFNLDFGAAFGGSFSAKAVRMWLDPFIRETLTNMLVWPNRLVIPMLPESVTGPLDDLMLRCAHACSSYLPLRISVTYRTQLGVLRLCMFWVGHVLLCWDPADVQALKRKEGRVPQEIS